LRIVIVTSLFVYGFIKAGRTAVIFASITGFIEVVRMLLEVPSVEVNVSDSVRNLMYY